MKYIISDLVSNMVSICTFIASTVDAMSLSPRVIASNAIGNFIWMQVYN